MMTIVPTQVSYQPLRSPDGDHPLDGMELHFLFLTHPGKSYTLRSTTDGINYQDHGTMTFPPNARLVVTTNPKEKDVSWMQLVIKE